MPNARKLTKLDLEAITKQALSLLQTQSKNESVDSTIESYIVAALKAINPNILIVSEELGVLHAEYETQTVIIDPIDGTGNFLRGIPIYAVAIALVDKATLTVTVDDIVACSVTSSCGHFSASQDDAICNLDVDQHGSLADYLLRTNRNRRFRLLGSSIVELCLMSKGSIDGFVETNGLKLVDIIPVLLLLKKSGCVIRDLYNRELVFQLERPKEERYQFLAATDSYIHTLLHETYGRALLGEHTVLITGVGAAAGINALRALKRSGVRVIGVNCLPQSAGFKMADEHYIVPYAYERDYIDKILAICQMHHVELILPTVDEEIEVLSSHRERFNARGIKLALFSEANIDATLDKWRFFQLLTRADIPTPMTWSLDNCQLEQLDNYPYIVKPKKGRGGKGIVVVNNPSDLEKFINSINKDALSAFIIQEMKSGEEMTVDVFCDVAKGLYAIVPRVREDIKAGICWKGRTVVDPQISDIVKRLVTTYQLSGGFCLQLFKTTDGNFFIFELNPRIGGTTSLTIEAGVNIPLLIYKQAFALPIEATELTYRPLAISRYFEDVFFDIQHESEGVK